MNSILLNEFNSSQELLDQVYLHGLIKNYKSGDVILEERVSIRSIPIVTKGLLKVTRTEEDGREILLYYIKAGESCIMSFLGGLHNEKSIVRAKVEEETEIIFLPINKVSHFIKEHPEWLDYIFRLYHKRFEELLSMVNSVAFQKIDIRLLHLLNQKSQLYKTKDITVTHQQLADELGVTREATSRVLKQLEKDGSIQLHRNRITLM